MIRLFQYIVVLLILFSHSVNAQINQNVIEIFTSNDIREAGLVNLNDIADLSASFHKTNINGYSGRAVTNHLSTFQNQNIIVLVNGQKIDLTFLGEFNLDVLPFNVDQVDSIIIVSTNTIYKGYSSTSGLIEFIVSNESEGFTLKTFQSIGNEVGDPGPYAYTPYKTTNVDKLGFILGLSLKSSGNNWNISTNLKFNENFVTDPAISARINELTSDSKSGLLGANSILSYRFLGGSHQLIFNFSENDDFVYLPIFGNEIPSKRVHRHIGFSGKFPISKKIKIKYAITNGINEYARAENEFDLNFNLKVNSTLIASNLLYEQGNFQSLIGLEYQKFDGNRSGSNNDEQHEFLKTNFNIVFPVFINVTQHAGIQLTKNNENNGISSYLRTEWNPNKYNLFSLAASYSSIWINEELNYYTWTKSNFPTLNSELVNQEIPSFTRPKKTLALDIGHKFNSDILDVNSSLFFRQHKDFYLEDIIYNVTSKSNLLMPLYNMSDGHTSQTAGGRINIRFDYSKVVTSSISYDYFTYFNSSSQFSNEWKKVPDKRIKYDLTYRINDNFLLRGVVRYYSKTMWNNFTNVTTQSNKKYNHILNEKLLVDLSLQKSFWQSKIWISILFKNLFNQTEVYHPIGVNLGLRFYLQLRINMENLFN